MEGKEKAVSDWDIYGSDNADKAVGERYGVQLVCMRTR